MAEIVVEKEICNACGVDAREGALFCYHCGSSLSPDVDVAEKEADSIGDSREEKFSKNGSRSRRKRKEKRKVPVVDEFEDTTDKPILKPEINEDAQLNSAAALRKRPKTLQKKKIEIVWEEHENAPNLWFIAVAIVLTLFVLGIIWLALSFR